MSLQDWRPPSDWTRIRTIDLHTAGEPFRVFVEGYPELPGATVLERRRQAREHFDHLRTALMWEPRGHADMYGAVLTEPTTPDGDFGTFFLHNEGYSTMCGHAMIASDLVRKMVRDVKRGRRTVRDCLVEMAECCSCGNFNLTRGERIFREMMSKYMVHSLY